MVTVKQLMELAEKEELVDLEHVEIQVDLIEPTVSAFAGLFIEENKMKVSCAGNKSGHVHYFRS